MSQQSYVTLIPFCLKYNPEKLVYIAPGHLKLTNGSFEFQQMDFTKLSLSNGYKYALGTRSVCFHID